jgi:16S rRNA (uracil1498-N3)-methyltransferase
MNRPEPQRRFYAPPGAFSQGLVRLGPEETHHLTRVLRLGMGDRVEVFDGQGRNFAGEVAGLTPQAAVLRLLVELPCRGESPLDLTLGIGLAKGEALDQVVRVATEMGVKAILPFESERSEQVSPERAPRRQGRWQRLARESLKSCRRSLLPRIELPQDFAAVLEGPEDLKIFFWEEEEGRPRESLAQLRPRSVRALIGPEGGFSGREAALARDAGYRVLSLGPRLLKVPTAAVAALTLIQGLWGDLA